MAADPTLGDLFGPGFDGIRKARSEGNDEARRLVEETDKAGWQRCGLAPNEIRQRFPRVLVNELLDDEDRELWDEPWYSQGPETAEDIDNRAKRLVAWMRSLANKHRAEPDATALLVSHGDCLRHLFGELFSGGNPHMRFSGFDNTSVSCVYVEADPRAESSAWCYFLNRVDHLDGRQLEQAFAPKRQGLGLPQQHQPASRGARL